MRRHRYLLSLPLPTPTRCPKARDDEAIVAQEVLDEYVVYDLLRHKVHALNPTAATVWQWCDGQTPFPVLTDRLGTHLGLLHRSAEPVLFLALDRLEHAKLLNARVDRPAAFWTMRRRRVLRLAAACLLPVVMSRVAPVAAQALSTGCPMVPMGCNPCGIACCDCTALGVFGNPPNVACCQANECGAVANAALCVALGGTVCQVC